MRTCISCRLFHTSCYFVLPRTRSVFPHPTPPAPRYTPIGAAFRWFVIPIAGSAHFGLPTFDNVGKHLPQTFPSASTPLRRTHTPHTPCTRPFPPCLGCSFGTLGPSSGCAALQFVPALLDPVHYLTRLPVHALRPHLHTLPFGSTQTARFTFPHAVFLPPFPYIVVFLTTLLRLHWFAHSHQTLPLLVDVPVVHALVLPVAVWVVPKRLVARLPFGWTDYLLRWLPAPSRCSLPLTQLRPTHAPHTLHTHTCWLVPVCGRFAVCYWTVPFADGPPACSVRWRFDIFYTQL